MYFARLGSAGGLFPSGGLDRGPLQKIGFLGGFSWGSRLEIFQKIVLIMDKHGVVLARNITFRTDE